MFEVGKRYIARNGDYSIRVLCLKRSARRVTFHVSERDARILGTGTKFTKQVEESDIPCVGGMREFVARVGSTYPGRDWCITDEEAHKARSR